MKTVIVKFLLAMATLLIVATIIANFVRVANACDYGTELDPRLINTDYVVIDEKIDPVEGIIFRTLLNKFGKYPQFVIISVVGNQINAFWYLNKKYELEVYAYLNTGHFGRTQFDPKTEKMITDGLLKMHGITSTLKEKI